VHSGISGKEAPVAPFLDWVKGISLGRARSLHVMGWCRLTAEISEEYPFKIGFRVQPFEIRLQKATSFDKANEWAVVTIAVDYFGGAVLLVAAVGATFVAALTAFVPELRSRPMFVDNRFVLAMFVEAPVVGAGFRGVSSALSAGLKPARGSTIFGRADCP